MSNKLDAADEVVVNTPQGSLVGEVLGEGAAAISTFKGIPYALPPVGVRRWKPAEPFPTWTGKRNALAFSPDCIQPSLFDDNFFYLITPQMSEDCLYLNVWAPSGGTNLSVPVMVWIHGGGLVDGAGSNTFYDGAELARKGVIVVSINYRLGIFGYFSHPELSAESPHQVSGNYGITDQIQALKWVQKNIAAFGGNPENVTVFGQSAGALSIVHLLTSPLSKGLFHRAIAQSPYMTPLPDLRRSIFGKPSAEQHGSCFAEGLGAASLVQLRSSWGVHLPSGESVVAHTVSEPAHPCTPEASAMYLPLYLVIAGASFPPPKTITPSRLLLR